MILFVSTHNFVAVKYTAVDGICLQYLQGIGAFVFFTKHSTVQNREHLTAQEFHLCGHYN